MKKHGEFMCPRCKGMANIRLSPLVYVFAVLAVAAGFLIYFFSKFVLDNVSLMTPLQVLIPFAVFFLASLFFVYLEKPVIKRVRKSADGRFFDENGNELKMKMGKMVNAAADTGRSGYTDHGRSKTASYSPLVPKQDDFDENVFRTAEEQQKPAEKMPPIQSPEVPEKEPDSDQQTADNADIAVGNIAKSRVGKSEPNSGFEDLFQTYSPSRPQPAKQEERRPAANPERQAEAPARKNDNEPRNKRSGGTRFRDL